MEKASRQDVYEMVTNRVIAAIENGVSPWSKPWRSAGGKFVVNGKPLNVPVNAITLKAYRGVNVLLLASSMHPFTDPRWLTFKQAQAAGGCVRKGEKGTPVVYWNWIKKEEKDPKTGEVREKRIPFLKYYTVFNVEQCDGLTKLPALDERKPEEVAEFNPSETAEGILQRMSGEILTTFGGDKACYYPTLDRINMPERESFKTSDGYYSTHFHELGHATGAESRLNRAGITLPCGFGSDSYAKEELVAELAAAFVCAHVGINCEDQSAAYLKGWLVPLKKDAKFLVTAAAAAQKAADYILGENPEEETLTG